MFGITGPVVYLLIFIGKLAEVSIMTLRIVFVGRGMKLLSALCGLIEEVLWVIVVSAVLTSIRTDPLAAVMNADAVEDAKLYVNETDATDADGIPAHSIAVVVQSGIGKVSAARCAQILIDRFAPDYLINTGVAGGVGTQLLVGDLVIGSELVQHDFDLTACGYAKGYIPGFGARGELSVFRSDTRLAEAFLRSASQYFPENRIRAGRIATGDTFVAAGAVKDRLREAFGAIAAEMEGGAIAQTAQMCCVPFVVIRAISDLADGTAVESFQKFEQETARLSASVLETMIRNFT